MSQTASDESPDRREGDLPSDELPGDPHSAGDGDLHGDGSSGGGGVRQRIGDLRAGGRGLFVPFSLSVLIAAALLTQMVRSGGFYQVAANTRALDLLGRAGIIRITTADLGSFLGQIPDVKNYVQANDYIDWIVVYVAIAIMLLVWALKALQFHNLARFCGSRGTFDKHARAYFYGHGINRIFPYNVGDVAAASALEGQGVARQRAAQIVYLGSLMVVFETTVFGLYALLAQGYTKWLAEIAWPFAILGAAFFITRVQRGSGQGVTLRQHVAYARQMISALATDRVMLVKVAVLSLLAFFATEMTVYLISQAFTTTFVILNVQFNVIIMAVVGGYLARLIPVTPGGLGQWEMGFAMPLYVSGMGMPEAVTMAFLMTFFRYLTGGVLFAAMLMTRGIETNLPRVLATFRNPGPVEGSTATVQAT